MWPLDKLKKISIAGKNEKDAAALTADEREEKIIHLRDLLRLTLRGNFTEEDLDEYHAEFSALGAVDVFYQVYFDDCLKKFERRILKLEQDVKQSQKNLELHTQDDNKILEGLTKNVRKHYKEVVTNYSSSLKNTLDSQEGFKMQTIEMKNQLARFTKPLQLKGKKLAADESVQQATTSDVAANVTPTVTTEINR